MAEHDPTAAEVAAAIATLQAFEAAQHPVAAPDAVVAVPESTATLTPASPVVVDPYLARSVKSSPNGF